MHIHTPVPDELVLVGGPFVISAVEVIHQTSSTGWPLWEDV